MKFQLQSRRLLRWSAALFLSMVALPAFAGSHRSDAWASAHYDAAEKLRAALSQRNNHPTRQDYQRVLDAYRRVYYGAPTSGKADPSVTAVAELLVEMGHRFDDDALLRKAIRQYEFLRREYPGSGSRFEALLAIGKIYKDDLDESAHAKAAFQEFLRRYPHHHLADEASGQLNELEQVARNPRPKHKDEPTAKLPDTDAGAENTKTASPGAATGTDLTEVTGIHYWSTGECTRVAIKLARAVKFESERIDHPDRIFVDLLDTQLPSSLAGKSLDGDDGC